MNKLSSVALSAALVVAGVGATVSAEAHPYVGVVVGAPDGLVVETAGYGRPYYYGPYDYWHGRYWHHEFGRGRFERFHHERWERR
jgi:hypothetical protein